MSKSPALKILFSDDNLVAVEKPAGLATIPGRGEVTSVLQQLAAQLSLPWTGSADPRLRIVHRLDKDTSGVLLLAKNLPAQRHLSHQFQNNTIEKQYLALVAGSPREDDGEIDAPLAPHPTNAKCMIVTKHGRHAKTHWRVEARYRGMALIRAFPKTGKTHQIRVHLKHIGLPLLVDPLYNPATTEGLYLSAFKRDYRPTRGEKERPLIDRLTLHAERLKFANLDGSVVEIECTLPKDMRAAVNQLSRHAGR